MAVIEPSEFTVVPDVRVSTNRDTIRLFTIKVTRFRGYDEDGWVVDHLGDFYSEKIGDFDYTRGNRTVFPTLDKAINIAIKMLPLITVNGVTWAEAKTRLEERQSADN